MKSDLKHLRFPVISFVIAVILTFVSVCSSSAAPYRGKQVNDEVLKYSRTYKYINSDSFENFLVEHRGHIVVNNNDDDIVSISPNGFLEIKKSSFGSSRRIVLEADSDGNIIRQYFEGKNELDFSEGKEWFSDVLLDIVRKTGIGAEERIQNLYNTGGFEAVIDEIEDINDIKFYNRTMVNFIVYSEKTEYSRNVFNLYMKIFSDKYNFNDAELSRYLEKLERVVSNSTKGTILRNILERYKMDRSLMRDYLRATASLSYNTERGSVLRSFMKKYEINNDNQVDFFQIIDDMSVRSEKSNVLKPLLRNQKMDKRTLRSFLESLEELTSNSEKGAILYDVIPLLNGDEELTRAFRNVLHSMSSSYRYLTEDIQLAYESENYPYQIKKEKEVLRSALNRAMDYDPNTKKYITLRKVNRAYMEDEDVISKYFQVIRGMDNEFLRYNAMLDLLINNKLGEESMQELLEATSDLIGDGYSHAAGAVLREVMKQFPESKSLRDEFFSTLDRIEHNATREELLILLCERKDLNKEDLINIIKGVKEIDVDIEKATVLMKVKPLLPKNDSETSFVFNTYTKRIESEYEFNKVIDL